QKKFFTGSNEFEGINKTIANYSGGNDLVIKNEPGLSDCSSDSDGNKPTSEEGKRFRKELNELYAEYKEDTKDYDAKVAAIRNNPELSKKLSEKYRGSVVEWLGHQTGNQNVSSSIPGGDNIAMSKHALQTEGVSSVSDENKTPNNASCKNFKFLEKSTAAFRCTTKPGVSNAEKLLDQIGRPNTASLDRTNIKIDMNFMKAKDGRKIKRLAAAEVVERTKRHKADDSKINELKQQIMDLAELVPSKITQESVENIMAFITKCRGYLERNTFKVPEFVFKSKVPAIKKVVISPKTNEKLKPQAVNNTPKELGKKVSYAAAAKKGTNPPQKPRIKKPLTSEQISKVVDGISPFESAKYKLVYFDGMKRSKITWVKQLLYQSKVRPYYLGNVNWVENSKLEVCVNEIMAPELIKYMVSIKGITNDSQYSPIKDTSGEVELNQIKDRFKWQASEKNKNTPSRRMATIITKMKPDRIEEFKDLFLFRTCDGIKTQQNSIPAIEELSTDGMEL
ncbi:hypothetical protein AYI70_g4937, partial [Smittium culicis]